MKHSAFSTFRAGPFSLLWQPRAVLVCLVLAAVVAVLAVFILGTGTMALTPGEVLSSLFSGDQNSVAGRVINRVRVPRLVTGLCVGAALGMAGAIFQSISRNPLGSPDIIGFTTGAATGAVVQIVVFNAGPLATALAALAGGLGTAIVVYLLSLRRNATGGYRLVLVGIGIGAILSAVNTVLLARGNIDQALSAQVWLSGSLNARTWMHALPVLIGVIVALPIAMGKARALSLMEMGDDAAYQLGIRVERTRLIMMVVAVLLAAMATAAAGPIAFVALAAPQLVRRLTGQSGVPIIPAALMGAALTVAADLLSQNLPVRAMLPIGLTTGVLGGLYLLWLLTRTRTI